MQRFLKPMTHGTLARHGVLYFLAKVGPAAVTFGTVAVFTQLLTPAEYGQFALVSAWVLLTNALVFQWLRLSTLRFLPAYDHNRPTFVATVLTSFAILAGALVVLVVASSLLGLVQTPKPLWAGLFFLLAVAANEVLLEFARADLRPGRYMISALVRAVSGLVIGVLLIRAGQAGLGAIVGLGCGALLGAVMAGGGIAGRLGTPRVDRAIVGKLLRYGLPMTLGFSLEFVLGMSDRLLIGWLVGADAVGEYAVAYDLPRQTLGMLVASVALGALPLALRSAEGERWSVTEKQLRANALAIGLIGFPAAIGLVLVAPNVAFVFFGEEFHSAVGLLTPLVTVGILFHAVRGYYLDHAFQIAKRPLGHVAVAGSAALVNVVSNVVLLPKLGVIAAAYSTVFSYGLAMVLSVWIGRKFMPMPIPVRPLLLIGAASTGMALALLPVVDLRGGLGLAAQVGLGVTTYAALCLLFGVPGSRRAFAALCTRVFDPLGGGSDR